MLKVGLDGWDWICTWGELKSTIVHKVIFFKTCTKPEFLVPKFYIKNEKEVTTPGRKVEHLGTGDFAERRCGWELVVAA